MENPTTTDVSEKDARIVAQRHSLQSRHASALSKLMLEREDLRGVHALADLVDESLRWCA